MPPLNFVPVVSGSPPPFDGGGAAYDGIWVSELGLWVAVGYTGDSSVGIATSPDGINWTAQGNPFANETGGYGYHIAWSPSLGLLCAVGNSYSGFDRVYIATSPDGVTWTPQVTPADATEGPQIIAVDWSETQGQFVTGWYGAGAFGSIATSPDGVTWTFQTTPFDVGGEVQSVKWIDTVSLWVATGFDPTFNFTLITSPDAVTWTIRTSPLDGGNNAEGQWVGYSPTLGLILQGGGNFVSGKTLATSPDGIIWTNVDLNPYFGTSEGGYCYSIDEVNGRIIATGYNASSVGSIVETADLAAWNIDSNVPVNAGSLYAARYSADLDQVLVFGVNGGGASTIFVDSAAPFDWDPWSSPFDTFQGYRGCWSPELGMFVAAGAGQSFATDAICTSPDGRAWTGRGNPFIGGGTADAAWSPSLGIFVVAGTDGIAWSADGITWTFVAVDSGSMNAVEWSEAQGQFVLVGSTFDGQTVFTSPDGLVWTPQGSLGPGTGIAYSPALDLWTLAVVSGIYTSPDAVTWTAQTTPLDGGNIASVKWLPNNAVFIACGFGGPFTTIASPDGVTWTALATPADGIAQTYMALEGSGTIIILAASGSPTNCLFSSTDGGATWSPYSTSFDANGAAFAGACQGLIYSADLGTLVALGYITSAVSIYQAGPSILSTTGPAVPQAPVLAIPTAGSTVVDLTWSTPADGGSAITGYNVYRGTSSGGETLLTSLGVTNTFHDTGLTDGVTYFYKITAVNSVGEGAFSNERSATPTALRPPDAPTLVSAVGETSQVALAWMPNSPGDAPITSYNLYRGLVSSGEVFVVSLPVLPHHYIDFPLTNGVTYFYVITAVNAIGESAPSNELSAEPTRPSTAPRFFEGYQWRFIFTDIPAGVSPVMKADGAAGDAYAFIDLGEDLSETDVWITTRIAFRPDALALWLSGDAGYFGNLSPDSNPTDRVDEWTIDASPGWDAESMSGPSDPPDPAANEWQTVEYHISLGATSFTSELYVDGTLVKSGGVSGFGSPPTVRFLSVGQIANSADPASVMYVASVKAGAARGGSHLFSDSFASGDFSAWSGTSGAVSIVADPFGGSGGSAGGVTTTWANGLLTNRQIVETLDQSTAITCDVWPDDEQVNEIAFDGFPLIAQTKRLVYCLRREGRRTVGMTVKGPWWCRAAGVIMVPEDQGDADVPLTHLAAYDAWKVLEGRPCMDATGQLAGPYGFQFLAQRGNEIICALLKNTITSPLGGFCFIDAGAAFGGTTFFGGTIEETNEINYVVQQGSMVADAWTEICNAGLCDIVLTPIYDPINRPGYTHELNIYRLAGDDLPAAVFGWDKMNRSTSSVDRLHDATPGNFSDVVQYYVGQGGPPAPIQINAAAVSAFGYYWATQFFPDQTIPSAALVTSLAMQAITLSKQGKRTFVMNPTPERSPVPFLDYNLGDRVAVYTTKRLRVPTSDDFSSEPVAAFRVQAIPINITDDGIEQVQSLLVSPDWRQEFPFALKADAAADDAWAGIDLGSDHGEVWMTLEIGFKPGYINYVEDVSCGGGIACAAFDSTADVSWLTGLLNGFYVGCSPLQWYDALGAGAGGTPAPTVWQHAEFHYKSDGTNELYIDGDLVYTDSSGGTGNVRHLRIGLQFEIVDPRAHVYFRGPLKIGTGRGGHNLANVGDVSDLSFFDSTHGAVSQVDIPF